MAVTVNGYNNGNPPDQNSLESLQGRFIRQTLRLVLSGSYTSGGDTLTLASVQPANTSRLVKVWIIGCGPASSISNLGGNYVYVPGASSLPTTSPNGKLKIFATAGTEYSAGAYSTDATTDIIFAELLWSRN